MNCRPLQLWWPLASPLLLRDLPDALTPTVHCLANCWLEFRGRGMVGVYLKVRVLCSQSCNLTFITCTLSILVKITGNCLKCLSPQPPLAQLVFSSFQAQIRHLSMNTLLISSAGCNLIFLSFGFSGAYFVLLQPFILSLSTLLPPSQHLILSSSGQEIFYYM